MAATSDDANKVDRDAREAGAADEMGVDAMDDEAAWDTTRIPAVVVDDDDVLVVGGPLRRRRASLHSGFSSRSRVNRALPMRALWYKAHAPIV